MVKVLFSFEVVGLKLVLGRKTCKKLFSFLVVMKNKYNHAKSQIAQNYTEPRKTQNNKPMQSSFVGV
jgi:hypothetical protein